MVQIPSDPFFVNFVVANYMKAIEYYREALELNPLNFIARDRISWVEAKQNINK